MLDLVQPLPERGFNQCGRCRRHWSCVEQHTGPQVCATRLHRERPTESESARCCCTKGVEAYNKEGPKFMQRLVAKQKTGVKRCIIGDFRHHALQTKRTACILDVYTLLEVSWFMGTARVFRSGNSQAVRLPKQFRLKSEEVEIFRRGDEIVLREKDGTMERAFDLLAGLPDDLVVIARDRDQPQKRKKL